jgi:hypothetical protein
MEKLESFIETNRELFDDAEPPIGHFSRFEEKLERQAGKERSLFSRSMVMKIAAAVLVLLTVSVFIFDFSRLRSEGENILSSRENEFSSEFRDAVNYYDNATTTRMGEIHRLACCGQDVKRIYDDAMGQVNELNASSADLKTQLQQNPGDERIQSAILQNQQMKEKVLDNVILQLNRARK